MFLSIFLHSYSIFTCSLVMIPFRLEYNNESRKSQQIILFVPIYFDNFLIFISSPNEVAIPFLLFNIVELFIRIIEPFYKLNDSAIETISIIKTYYLYINNICH